MSEPDSTIDGKVHDLGDNFMVRRMLPDRSVRKVGPFVFFDHFGPVRLPPGQGMDVRPHPHIGLATVTWLFEGCIRHRDSLGNQQDIRPGEINWMTAGRGIVHSERSPEESRQDGPALHGIQTWVALPGSDEETEPEFHHYSKDKLPLLEPLGAHLRLMVGHAWGQRSPVKVYAPMYFVEARLAEGARIDLPPEHDEHAVYVVEGEVALGEEILVKGCMGVHRAKAAREVRARAESLLILIGGAPLDGPRIVWWNFVARTRERIDLAAGDWKAGRFPEVPGDEEEFIPLPEK
jgi:redox-sensitive bicupin YhaK (pirin superfamily)